jgi:hypothetical protein
MECINQQFLNACKTGNLEEAKRLDALGADINTTGNYEGKTFHTNCTCAEFACVRGYLDILKFLVEKGIVENTAQFHMCVFMATMNDHLHIIKYLMPMIHATKQADFVLCLAVSEGHYEIVKYVVANGADIHVYCDSPLQRACKEGHLDIVRYLVSQGADIHNTSALTQAISNGRLNVIKYLISQGSDFKTIPMGTLSNDNIVQEHLDTITYIIRHYSEFYVHNETLLTMAIVHGDIDDYRLARYLLEHGAKVRKPHFVRDGILWDAPLEILWILASNGVSTDGVDKEYMALIARRSNIERRRIAKAQAKLYFWWIQKCYTMSSPSGIRMAYRNLAAYETMCA